MFNNITIKRPDRDDILDLGPAVVVFLTWLFLTDRSMRRNAALLIPAVFGVVAWLLLKGLRYAPR